MNQMAKHLTAEQLMEYIKHDGSIPVYIQSLEGGTLKLAKSVIYEEDLKDDIGGKDIGDAIVISVSKK